MVIADFLLITLVVAVAALLVIILKKLDWWDRLAKLIDEGALIAIVVGVAVFYLAASFSLCPVQPACPTNACVWNWGNPGSWVNWTLCDASYESSNFACQTQAGAAISLCHMASVFVMGAAFLLIVGGLLKFGWVLLHGDD